MASLHAGLSATLLQLSQIEQALVAAREALRLDPKLASAWSALANALGNRNAASDEDLHDSLDAAQKGVAMAPRSAYQHIALSQALSRLGRGDEALGAARTALRLEPESAYAYAALALAHEALWDLEPAVQAWRTALESRPTLERAPAYLGAALLNLHRVAEAEREFRRQLSVRRTADVLIMLSQALTAEKSKRPRRAWTS